MSKRTFEDSDTTNSSNSSSSSPEPDPEGPDYKLDPEEDEEEAEGEPSDPEPPDQDPALKLVDMGGKQYTEEDPVYVQELQNTCPPHPLFVLRWNRTQRPPHFQQQRGNNRDYQQRVGRGQHHENQRSQW